MHDARRGLKRQMSGQLTAWERTELARHPMRPYPLDYIERIFPDFSEIHGDRGFGDDAAMVCGMARFHGREVMVIGTQKGRDTKQRIHRNFGQPNPEGYRKALRAMKFAEKWRRPVITLIDVVGRVSRPGRRRARTGGSHRAQPARDGAAEGAVHRRHHRRRRQRRRAGDCRCRSRADDGEQHLLGDLARRLRLDHVARLQQEGHAAQALRITAKDNLELGICDEVVPEPPGGAHHDYDAAANALAEALEKNLSELEKMPLSELLDARYNKFRNMAQYFQTVGPPA